MTDSNVGAVNIAVIDTNIVLDLFVFKDPSTTALREALETRQLRWISTSAMRDELERVLTYAHISARLAFHRLAPSDVLAQFDQLTHMVSIAPRATVICKDPDDQRFIDLAVAHRALLLSKDKAVLCMSKKLFFLGVYTKYAMYNIAYSKTRSRAKQFQIFQSPSEHPVPA